MITLFRKRESVAMLLFVYLFLCTVFNGLFALPMGTIGSKAGTINRIID